MGGKEILKKNQEEEINPEPGSIKEEKATLHVVFVKGQTTWRKIVSTKGYHNATTAKDLDI